ncbi:helix-turn-helix domain-containing protein [Leucobacter sp. BZR 635]
MLAVTPRESSTVPRFHSAAARTIGERIRDARRAEGISMDDLSELSEVSLTSIGKIERGAQSPSAETLIRIATALAIDPGLLVSGITSQDYGQRTRPYSVRDFMREQRARERAESERADDEDEDEGTIAPGDAAS